MFCYFHHTKIQTGFMVMFFSSVADATVLYLFGVDKLIFLLLCTVSTINVVHEIAWFVLVFVDDLYEIFSLLREILHTFKKFLLNFFRLTDHRTLPKYSVTVNPISKPDCEKIFALGFYVDFES